MMSAQADTTVTLASDTRDRLRAAKQGGETYDDVVNRLLEETGAHRAYQGS
jgi:hypothetical protein